MKYTVTIQQPVRDDRRHSLEQQLAERFNLSADQAARLAGRRTGRLMKPTSRTRAELLLDVFQLAGAAVALEEVHDETQMRSEPFQGLSSAPAPLPERVETPDEAVLAPLLPAPAWPSPLETSITPLEGAPFAFFSPAPASPDPFSSLPGETASGQAMSIQGKAVSSQEAPVGFDLHAPVVDGLTVDTDTAENPDVSSSIPADSPAAQPSTAPSASAGGPALHAPEAQLPDTAPSRMPPQMDLSPPPDVWSDFTGSLTLTDASPATSAGATSVETVETGGDPLGAVVPVVPAAGGGPVSGLPRRPLSRQLMLGTLAPLALSSAVTLGVLVLALPAAERQATQQQAQTLAAAVGAILGDNASAAQINSRLGAVVATPGVGFVRAELPEGKVALRAQNADFVNSGKVLSDWLGSHASGGTLKLGNTQYVVAQSGQAGRRVALGLPSAQANAALRTTLWLVLLAALLGLALAVWLAARATRQITGPIDRLVKAADAISMGDLSRPVHPDDNNEIGDLAVALERMRQSLEAAMERLRRRRKG